MKINLKLIFSMIILSLMQTALAQTKYSSTIQATMTGGSNNSMDETFAAKVGDLACGHLPGEAGYTDPSLSIGDHSLNSDNTSIYLGTVYSIDSNQSIDIAYIKHFYNSSSRSSHSQYLA